MLKLIGLAIKGGSLLEWVVLGLAVLVLAGGIYCLGFARGTNMCVTAQAKVTAAAVPKATAAQAEQDAKDYRRGVEDGKDLGRRAQAADDTAIALKARSHVTAAASPPKPGCPPQVIPAALMADLNDPKLIGGAQ